MYRRKSKFLAYHKLNSNTKKPLLRSVRQKFGKLRPVFRNSMKFSAT